MNIECDLSTAFAAMLISMARLLIYILNISYFSTKKFQGGNPNFRIAHIKYWSIFFSSKLDHAAKDLNSVHIYKVTNTTINKCDFSCPHIHIRYLPKEKNGFSNDVSNILILITCPIISYLIVCWNPIFGPPVKFSTRQGGMYSEPGH